MSADSLTMTIPEVAKVLGISRGLAYQLAARGELPGLIRLGGKRVVCSKLSIEKLLQGESKATKKETYVIAKWRLE